MNKYFALLHICIQICSLTKHRVWERDGRKDRRRYAQQYTWHQIQSFSILFHEQIAHVSGVNRRIKCKEERSVNPIKIKLTLQFDVKQLF